MEDSLSAAISKQTDVISGAMNDSMHPDDLFLNYDYARQGEILYAAWQS